MKKLFLVILIALAPLVSAKEKGWVTLYNGKDLTGWQTTGNWLPQKDGSAAVSTGIMSWPSSTRVTAAQAANRMRLRTIMLKNGFRPLQEEWWHFTLENEPFPDRYFEFEIIQGALD
jgi:hypothetical protein